QVALALPLLDVLAAEALDVGGIEHRGPGLDVLEEALQRLQVLAVEHARLARGLVRVVGVHVPAAEDDVIEAGDGDELVDARAAVVGPLAQAHRAHLREAADGLREALADGLHAGHERRGHRAHAWEQDAELPFRGRDRAPPPRAGAHGWNLPGG